MAQPGDESMSDKTRSNRERFLELFREGPSVDRSNLSRVTPMKVLCFGLPRTGTVSMRVALAALEISRVHHMVDVFYNSDDAQWFNRANDAKHFGKGTFGKGTFGKEDWDKLLGDCQGCIDMPTAFFAEELIAAYPDAKVVLMERDFPKWYHSMSNTIFRSRHPNPIGRFILWLDMKETRQAAYVAQDIMNAFLGPQEDDYDNVKIRYSQYFDMIRQRVPKEKLLEFSLSDGYEPLCKFLDVPVPKENVEGKEVTRAFPYINETSHYQDRMKVLYQRTARRVLADYVAKPLGLGALAMGVRTLVGRFH